MCETHHTSQGVQDSLLKRDIEMYVYMKGIGANQLIIYEHDMMHCLPQIPFH